MKTEMDLRFHKNVLYHNIGCKKEFYLKQDIKRDPLLQKRGKYYWFCIILANNLVQAFVERNVCTQLYCQKIDKKNAKT